MAKTELTPNCLIPVRPILIGGANVGGKANFLNIGAGGWLSSDPPMVALPIRPNHFTLKGILENRTFSVNIPAVENVKEADYCGMVSGENTDKAKDCKFNIFYGKLKTAPMIDQFPINLECSLQHIWSTASHAIVIGRVEGTFVSPEYLKDGKLDMSKLNPLIWVMDGGEYFNTGKPLGKVRTFGSQIKK